MPLARGEKICYKRIRCLLLVSALMLFYQCSVVPEPVKENSIAVLPFANLSNDQRQYKTQSNEAYLHLLRGRKFNQIRTPEFLLRARDEFTMATKLDPKFAEAHVDLDIYIRAHSITNLLRIMLKQTDNLKNCAQANGHCCG